MEYLDEIINMRIKPSDKLKLTALALSDNLSVFGLLQVKVIKRVRTK